MPIDYFLVDPPIRIDPELERKLQLSDVGVKIIGRPNVPGVFDVYDVVGQKFYPNVADVLEETRRYGVSRRISVNEDFAKLTPESRLMLMHRRAWIGNFDHYYGALLMESTGDGVIAPDVRCPKRSFNSTTPRHSAEPEGNSGEMCLGLVYDDVDGLPTLSGRNREVTAKVGETEYTARHRPDGVLPDYTLAIFARFPILQIDVIRDKAQGSHVESHQKATKAGIPVELADE